MSTTPNWRAPASGDSALASDVTQLLGTHGITMLYQGTAKVSGPGSKTGVQSTNSQNLLSANAASIETDTTAWPTLVNCAVAKSATQALDQANSLRLTASSAATMSAETTTGTGGVPVAGSTQYTALVWTRANSSTRSCTVGIQWYTAAGASISTSTGSGATNSNSAWTAYSVTATSPSNAAFAAVIVTVTSPANGEIHFVDQASLAAGAVTSVWTPGTGNHAGAVYIDQPFTTASGQTTVTRIELMLYLQGTGADLTIGLYADSGGNPTGAALFSLVWPLEFEPNSVSTLSMPINVTGLSALTKYHIVINGTSSSSNFVFFGVGATTGSAYQTSTTGVGGSWTAGTGSLQFNVYAGVDGVLRHTWEDSGNRWTGYDYAMGSAGTSGPPTTVREYTLGTSVANSLRSQRTASYSSGLLTSTA